MPNQWVLRRSSELVWVKTDNLKAYEKFSPEILKKTIQKIENLIAIKPKDPLSLPNLVTKQYKHNQEKIVTPSQNLKDLAVRWKAEFQWA